MSTLFLPSEGKTESNVHALDHKSSDSVCNRRKLEFRKKYVGKNCV